MASVSQQLFFSGRVQGVGFRWTTERLARELQLSGFVRNLPDGRVEVVATGELPLISLLIERLKDHFGEGIRDIERKSRGEIEEFSGFTTRR